MCLPHEYPFSSISLMRTYSIVYIFACASIMPREFYAIRAVQRLIIRACHIQATVRYHREIMGLLCPSVFQSVKRRCRLNEVVVYLVKG